MRFILIGVFIMACDGGNPAGGDAVQDVSDTLPIDTIEPDTGMSDTVDTVDDTGDDTVDTVDDTGRDTVDTVDDTGRTDDSVDTSAGDTTDVDSFTMALGSWSMQPGQETTRCVVKRLGNRETIRVNQIQTTLSRGSHHFIVYKSSDTTERTTPFPCTPFTETLGGQTVPLMISQIREETLTLPEGVAFELGPNQMIRLEAHYLNYFPDPIETNAEVRFEVTRTAETLANFLFYGTTQVHVPAGQTVTTPWRYHSVPSGSKVFGLTGHTHALGTNVEVEQSSSNTASGVAVYPPEGKRFDWAEAPVALFEPPLSFNNNGFRFRCTWNNTTNSDVGFGESATQEMCFFWAYYYPSQGFILRF